MLVLDAPAGVEEVLVGGELDPVRTQVVGVRERERARRDRALDAEPPAAVEPELARVRVHVEAALQQLVVAGVLVRQHLEAGPEVRIRLASSELTTTERRPPTSA